MSERDDYPELQRITMGIGVEVIDDAEVQAEAALDEIARLRRWKAEAIDVLAAWELVWDAAGRPGRPGQSKAEAVRRLLDANGARA